MGSEPAGPLRFADILTTASAVASYLGSPAVTAAHMVSAIAVLCDEATLEDLGRPVSPLVTRGGPGAVEAEVTAIVQRWFALIGNDADALLDAPTVRRLEQELRTLAQ
ncbi:MAG: hypothetical protein ACR2NO_00830 [Chloroflexota bacterium]